jgi:hypothetical protein
MELDSPVLLTREVGGPGIFLYQRERCKLAQDANVELAKER